MYIGNAGTTINELFNTRSHSFTDVTEKSPSAYAFLSSRPRSKWQAVHPMGLKTDLWVRPRVAQHNDCEHKSVTKEQLILTKRMSEGRFRDARVAVYIRHSCVAHLSATTLKQKGVGIGMVSNPSTPPFAGTT